MAKVVKQADGSYVAVTPDGRRVPVSPEQLEAAKPTSVLNEQGVTLGERFYLKNFLSNDQSAMAFLRGQGYEVRKYGNHPLKMQFAVRKNAADPWRVVDPDGFDPEDLLDLVADVGQGAAITAATAGTGGLGGAAVAGALAGGGTELLRQGIGAAGGGAENIDPTQIASQAAGGALAEPIARGIGAVTRGVSKAALELGARVSGVRAGAGMTGAEALSEFASRKPLGRAAKIPSFQEVADRWHAALTAKGSVVTEKFPESVQFNELLSNAKTSGLRYDVTPVLSKFEDLLPVEGAEVASTATKRSITEAERQVSSRSELASERFGVQRNVMAGPNKPGKEFDVARELESVAEKTASTRQESTVTRTTFERPEVPRSLASARSLLRGEVNPTQVRSKLDAVINVLQKFAEADGEPLDLTRVSPEAMNTLRQDFQFLARQARDYDGLPIPQGYKSSLRDAARDIRGALLKGMNAAGGDYRESARLLRIVDSKTRVLNAFRKALKSPDDFRNFIQKVYGKYQSAPLRAVSDLKKTFGVDLLPEIRAAQAGAQVSQTGAAPGTLPILPQFGYHGGIAGLIGYSLGGAPGVLEAVAASSPRTVVAATRVGQQAAKALDTPAVSMALREAGTLAIQADARMVGKGLARDRKPRRRVVIGG